MQVSSFGEISRLRFFQGGASGNQKQAETFSGPEPDTSLILTEAFTSLISNRIDHAF
jgi:hypothetical protein